MKNFNELKKLISLIPEAVKSETPHLMCEVFEGLVKWAEENNSLFVRDCAEMLASSDFTANDKFFNPAVARVFNRLNRYLFKNTINK